MTVLAATTDRPTTGGTVNARRRMPTASVLGARYGLFAIWLLMIAFFGMMRPRTFLTASNFQSIFASQSVLLFLSLGLVVSLISGDFNLALPGVFSSCLVLIGVMNGKHHLPWGVAVIAALSFAFVLGLVHAFLIVKVRLSSFIVTLGTGTALLGVAYAISDVAISNLSRQYVSVITTKIWGFEMVFVYALMATTAIWYVSQHTPLGRHLYFVGASQDVARLAGLDVNRLRTVSIVASSMLGGLGAVVGGGYLGTADPALASSFLLPMFASTLLGSTAVTPGRPNAWGTAAAAYFLVTGFSGLQLLGLHGWIQQVFYGSALVVAVLVATLMSRRIGQGGDLQMSH